MSVADHPPPTRTDATTPVSSVAPPAPGVDPAPTLRRGAELGHGLDRPAGRVLAGLLALAWIVCPVVEPLPEHDMAYPLWQLPIDLATLVTIVGAVAAAWRGSRYTAPLTLAAGAFMAVETAICPYAGHTPIGWWTWVQTAMSLGVMATGVALYRLRRP